MFTINYNISHYNYSIADTERVILGGMVATFAENRRVTVCDPSQIPIGFFSSDYAQIVCYTRVNSIGVVIGQGEYLTDVYEQREYKTNDLLYCNIDGKISNNPVYKGNPTVGVVNDVDIDDEGIHYIGFISFFSNLESVAKPHNMKILKQSSKSKNTFNRYTALSRRNK